MTWAAANDAAISPLIGNWDFAARPVAFPGSDFDATAVQTGDRSSPGVWVDLDINYQPGEYLASGSSNSRKLYGTIDAGIMVEPIASTAEYHATAADLLETYYNAGSTSAIHFRVQESYLTGVTLWEDAWLRRDWVCPFWRFEDLGDSGETWLAGQTANQIIVTQASHGFTVGKWIGFTSGAWALATTATPVRARGVVSTVTDSSTFTVTTGDVVKITAHGHSTAGTGALYLSTSGDATTTEPGVGTDRQELGAAIGTDHLIVQIGELTPG